MRRYEDIFEEMLSCYDIPPEKDSSEYIRVEMLAHQIFALSAELDRAEKSLFISTAEGEFLDRHALSLGIMRKNGGRAKGLIEFSVDMPLDYDLTIPMGSVVCQGDDISLQYETTQEKILEKGNLSVSVNAQALGDGRKYNCSIGKVLTAVFAPAAIDRVRSITHFSGGCEKESDFSLRKRLTERVSKVPTGANAQSYVNLALEDEEIMSAAVKVIDADRIGVYVYGNGCTVSENALERTALRLKEQRGLFTEISVINAQEENINLIVYINTDDEFEELSIRAETLITDYINALGVGESFYRAGLIAYLMDNLPINNVIIPSSVEDTVFQANQVAAVGEIRVMKED